MPTDTEVLTSVLTSLFGNTAGVTIAQMDLTNLVGGGVDLTPVTVRPTQTQLDRATDLEIGNTNFNVEDGATCTIFQEGLRA
jgi:hypothetical protein